MGEERGCAAFGNLFFVPIFGPPHNPRPMRERKNYVPRSGQPYCYVFCFIVPWQREGSGVCSHHTMRGRCPWNHRAWEGGGRTQFVHGRNRMTIDPRIPTMSRRSTSVFRQPGRHCLHQARSAVRCLTSRMKGELHPSKKHSQDGLRHLD